MDYSFSGADSGPTKSAETAASQLLIVAVLALIPVETARVWLFMMPLALPAVGRELARWSDRERAMFFAVAAVTLVVIGQNMTFFSFMPGA